MQKHVQGLDIYPNYDQKIAIEKKKKLRSRLIYKIIPANIYIPFRQELRVAWIRFRNRNISKRYKNAKDLLVNLGSGGKGKPGWVNVDIVKAPNVNCIYDCRKDLPFPDGSVECIFCEHFFEHLDYTEEVPYFLSECHRVLKVGGVMRIIVPDAEKYLQAYCKEGWEDLSEIRPLDTERTDFYFGCKYHTKMELINVVFRQGYEHKYACDYATLEFLLYRYGFSTVQRQEFGKSFMNELLLDQPRRSSESLYVEAVK